jgi:proteasome lid subunit RPN8/RPN11
MLEIPDRVLEEINRNGEHAFPEEGAGFLLGRDGNPRRVEAIFPLENARESTARHNRYLITPQAMLQAELVASKRGLDLLGVFHSHPDHPNQPSTYDLEWALPYFSYLITSVQSGVAVGSRSWRLRDDRSAFDEEQLQMKEEERTIE